jgi:hypothetical protein
VWCVYEIYVSLTNGKLLYDAYTVLEGEANAVGLTDGAVTVDYELAEYKAGREAQFPLSVAGKALATEVAKAQATIDDDRKHILNAIAERDLELPPEPAAHRGYTKINYVLRGKFAAAALVPAVWADFKGIDMHMLFWSLKVAPLTKLELSFEGCTNFTDDTAMLLADHLPMALELLVVEAAASSAGEAGMDQLFRAAKAISTIKHVRLKHVQTTGPRLARGPVWLDNSQTETSWFFSAA